MAKGIEVSEKHIGTFGEYNVSEVREEGRIFIPSTTIVDGEEETKTIPLNRFKVVITLQHRSGDVVKFSKYKHRGQMLYKDWRDAKKSHTSPNTILDELKRMLGCDTTIAQSIIGDEYVLHGASNA